MRVCKDCADRVVGCHAVCKRTQRKPLSENGSGNRNGLITLAPAQKWREAYAGRTMHVPLRNGGVAIEQIQR